MPSRLERVAIAHRRALRDLETETLRPIVGAYQQAAGRLADDIDAVSQMVYQARQAGTKVNPSWLYRQARARDLLTETEAAFNEFAGHVGSALSPSTQRAVALASDASRDLIAAGLPDTPGAFKPHINRGAVQSLTGSLSPGSPVRDVLDSYGPSAAGVIEDELLFGSIGAESPRVVAARIADQLGGKVLTRALTLARSELNGASREATGETYRNNRHLVRAYQRLAAKSSRTCLACIALDGTIYPLDRFMPSHVNCFPAGTIVSGPRPVGSSERWYEGDLLDITFASGKFLSVTPNHPILTPQGWVAAGTLVEGRNVVGNTGTEGVFSSVNPDDNDRPSLIEDVAISLRGAKPVASVRVPTSPMDFHGDGRGSNVHVIRADGELGGRFNAASLEPFGNQQFGRGGVGLADLTSNRSFTLLFPRLNSHTCGDVRGRREGFPLFGGHPRMSRKHTFASVAGGNSGNTQPGADDTSGNAVRFSERFFRLPLDVPSDDFTVGQSRMRSTSVGALEFRQTIPIAIASEQTAAFNLSTECLFARVESGGDDLRALSGNVVIDCVLNVSSRRFSGHVYNLQTPEGWYIANGIIVHNCRCAMIPVLYERFGTMPKIESGVEWFDRQPAATQRQMMGRAAYGEYRAGNVTLLDFVGHTNDPVWGESIHEQSLRQAMRRERRAA